VTLKKGTLLGPYVVDVLLGAGGMGEVYRARDSRLERTVAIKVLLPNLTAGDERRARFEREARAISALSSPHICAVYDVGRADDIEYLVMEYLEGETLAERIARGPLPLSQILRFATEIAEALRDAHRAGITHRDLKPGNVMLTASGVKLLDFGLAKLETQSRIFSTNSAPSTVVNPITAEGTIVGTVLYMAPEQLEGKTVDQRTDIFGLGVILYEMVTGQRPFGGSSHLSVIASIISADPLQPRSLQPACPPALERIILTALEKNPDDRWQTAHDVARQLRWLSEPSGPMSVETRAVVPPKSSRRMLLAFPAAAAIGGLLMWGGMRYAAPSAATSGLRLHLAPPDDVHALPAAESPNFALSPDGQTLAYTGLKNGAQAVFLRRLDSFDVRKVDGSDDGNGPFWSSDGQWLGFSAHGKLWKTKLGSGGVPEALCDVIGTGAVASWVGDTILFADRAGGRAEIYRVSAHGGPATKQTIIKKDEWRHSWPRLLADGRHYLYESAATDSIERRLILASLDKPESSVLTKNVSQASFVSGDQLTFVRDGKLLSQHIDVEKGSLTGEPSLVAGDVAYFYPSGRANFDAANGVIVYRTDTSTGRLLRTDRSGKRQIIDDKTLFDDLSLSISPDGRQAAVTVLDRGTGLGDIWLYDLARGGRDRLTNEPALAITPVWTTDGRAIVYSTAGAGSLPRVVRRPLASSTSEPLTPPGRFQFAGSFSPDGSTLYFSRHDPQTRSDIFKLDMRTLKSEPVLNTGAGEDDPQLSSDGQWLAYTSDASGVDEVYLQNLAHADLPRVRISTNGGNSPRWRHDGGELFYASAQNGMMSVVPQSAGAWSIAKTTELFRMPANTLRFDAAPDGQSFLFVEGSHGAADSLFHVILGWR
jgi:serine/threonine protein kinase/Tol biopolymer transport system component